MRKKYPGKGRKIKLRTIDFALVFLAIICISAFITILIYQTGTAGKVYAVRTLPINLTVTEPMHVGLGLRKERDMMFFGAIPPLGKGYTQFAVTNEYDKELLVRIEVEGELKPWIEIAYNDFILEKNETRKVDLIAYVPENASLGQRNSTLIVTFLRT
ncbi:MAG: hypothetical protein NTV63_03855 [Candidatus Woesearchaeota archaeon]|nr:hypothetical protein [Candidatus Woesearchaeota archaeon]